LRSYFYVTSTRIFLFTTTSKPALGPNQPPPQWVKRLFLGVKRPVREANHSTTSSTKFKNAWSYTSIPHMHGVVDNLTFILPCFPTYLVGFSFRYFPQYFVFKYLHLCSSFTVKHSVPQSYSVTGKNKIIDLCTYTPIDAAVVFLGIAA
jgi:hypothetical protein